MNYFESDEWQNLKKELDTKIKQNRNSRLKIKYNINPEKVMESLKFFNLITENEYKDYLNKFKELK